MRGVLGGSKREMQDEMSASSFHLINIGKNRSVTLNGSFCIYSDISLHAYYSSEGHKEYLNYFVLSGENVQVCEIMDSLRLSRSPGLCGVRNGKNSEYIGLFQIRLEYLIFMI